MVKITHDSGWKKQPWPLPTWQRDIHIKRKFNTLEGIRFFDRPIMLKVKKLRTMDGIKWLWEVDLKAISEGSYSGTTKSAQSAKIAADRKFRRLVS